MLFIREIGTDMRAIPLGRTLIVCLMDVSGSIVPVPGWAVRSAIGASRPLRSIPAIVSFLNP